MLERVVDTFPSLRIYTAPPYSPIVQMKGKNIGNSFAAVTAAELPIFFCLPPYDKPLLLSLLSNFIRKPAITLAVVNILINYRQSGCGSDGSMGKTQQLIKPRSRGRQGDVTR